MSEPSRRGRRAWGTSRAAARFESASTGLRPPASEHRQDGTHGEQGVRSGQIILVVGVVLAAAGVLAFSLGVNNVTSLNEGVLVVFGVLAVVLGLITALAGVVLMVVLGRRPSS